MSRFFESPLESSRSLYYAPDGTPIDLETWCLEFEHTDRVIARTRHKERGREFVLSTVYVGLNLSLHLTGPPLIYETMVFELRPPAFGAVIGESTGGSECDRWATRDEAIAGHDAWAMTA